MDIKFTAAARSSCVKLVENWVKMRLFEGVDFEGFGLVMLLTCVPFSKKYRASVTAPLEI